MRGRSMRELRIQILIWKCEGSFKSKFFRNDEDDDELMIGMRSVDLKECAENCVKSFNNLMESQINEICKELINCAKESSDNEEIVYCIDVFEGGDIPIIDRHIDIEYSFGDYYEVHEDNPLFQLICTLCNLSLAQEEEEMENKTYRQAAKRK